MKNLNNSSILITGGTGSFGQAFIKQLLKEYPKIKRLVIFSRDELKQDHMRVIYPETKYKNIRYFLGDVRDYNRLLRALDDIDIIIHAAALKQVPTAEYNPIEFIKTNVLGAQNIIEAAIEKKIKKVISLSSDKACAPINLYGATKLCSDKLFVAANTYASKYGTFSVVRYGNVMGSRGSVIPLFLDQIAKEKPLSITDPSMTRFMMNLDEAINLVIYAFKNGKQGDIFVQKSPSATIGTLVRAILDTVNKPDYPVINIGIRHGEKLYETLISAEELPICLEENNFFRIKTDTRDLNYDKYFNKGVLRDKNLLGNREEYNSNNTTQLDVKEMSKILLDSNLIISS